MSLDTAAGRTGIGSSPRPLRVLIVDDSSVVRRSLADMLGSQPDIEVVGSVASGRLALANIRRSNPDLVTLDVEMPDLDGLATLAAIKEVAPSVVVIMVSAQTQRCAAVTLEALSRGAADYVAKPSNATELARMKEELLGKVRALGRRPSQRTASAVTLPSTTGARGPSASLCRARPEPQGRIDLLAVGCSTGGPEALAQMLGALPAALPVPVVVVQHMPPMFTRLLAERLDGKGGMRVSEASAGVTPLPGCVYVAPGDSHLMVRNVGAVMQLALTKDPPENGCRPAVDVLFRSAARVARDRLLAVVLTGMGQDGCRGADAVTTGGGSVWIQDEESSAAWGMPGSISRAGLFHRVVLLRELGPALLRRTAQGREGTLLRKNAR